MFTVQWDFCDNSQFRLIENLGGAVGKFTSKSISSQQKYDSVVSLSSENGTKVSKKLAKDFHIPTKTLTTVLKNRETKQFQTSSLSEYTRKYHTVSGNSIQSIILTLARLWH